MGVATFIAVGVGIKGISTYRVNCWGHCGNGGEVHSSFLFGFLELFAVCLQELTLGKKGTVGELGLVLEPDPVPGIMVSHSMLRDHDFEHFHGLR